MRVLNVGVIGCGYFAGSFHLPNISKSKSYKLRALCDLDKNMLELRSRQFKPEYSTQDLNDLINDEKIDVIFIIVQHHLHVKLISMVAPSGKAIFIEKPLALTMKDCEKVVKLVKKYKNKLMIGFNRRFAPSMAEAKSDFLRRRGQAIITYRMATNRARYSGGIKNSWRLDAKKSGGDLMGEACHIFDLLAWFTEEEPVSIYSAGWWEDNTITTIKYTGDIVAVVTSCGVGDVRYPKERMEIFRDRGTIVNDYFLDLYSGIYHRYNTLMKVKEKQFYAGKKVKGIKEFADEMHKNVPFNDRMFDQGKTDKYIGVPKPDKGWAIEIEEFAKAIRENLPSPVSVIDGSRSTLCGLKAIRSIKTGMPQKIKPEEYFL